MDRPFIVVMVSSTVDGRIAVNPNLTMWEEMDDVRTLTEGGAEIWEDVESYIERLYSPEADMLGSNSLVKEGDSLTALPAFKGDKESLFQDFLPKDIVNKSCKFQV